MKGIPSKEKEMGKGNPTFGILKGDSQSLPAPMDRGTTIKARTNGIRQTGQTDEEVRQR